MFDHDVFISYPHLSNKDDASEQNGWVARFHNDLENKLNQAVGHETSIWRDSRMPIGTQFGKAISNRLGKAKVLVCLISPAYLQSEWCRRELEQFRKSAAQNGGLTVGEQSRVIVVIQIPAAVNELGLGEGLYSKFYDVMDAGVPVPYGQAIGGYKYEQYEKNLWGLAWAIKPIIEKLADGRVDTTRTVYLAESTNDRQDERERIAEELRARKYIVLPENELSARTFQDYTAAVGPELKRAFMSIHLLGESIGPIPDRAHGKSTIQIQCELAGARCSTDSSFKRLLWIPDKLPDLEENQREFLQDMRTKGADVSGTELVERSFEDLKTRLLQILTKTQPNRRADGRVRIYIMSDKRDDDSVLPVGQFLGRKGYEVLASAEKKSLKYHKDRLLDCQAALTIYGKADYDWVIDRYDDVDKKVKGWGREKGIPYSAILRTDPETLRKKILLLQGTKVLEPPCYDGVSEEALEKPLNEFIDELEHKLTLGAEA